MYLRKLRKTLTPRDVRDLVDAAHFAKKLGKQLNTTISINPKLLADYPGDIGEWVSKTLLNNLRVWCQRQGFGYHCLWVRENYIGDRREHVHLLMHVPEAKRSFLEAALRRWLSGDDKVVKLGRPEYETNRFGQSVNKALTYVLKQMTPQAWWSLGKQVRREKCCDKTGLPVAPVLGNDAAPLGA
jgi:hypothetical protein